MTLRIEQMLAETSSRLWELAETGLSFVANFPPAVAADKTALLVGAQRVDDFHPARLDRRQEPADESHHYGKHKRGNDYIGSQCKSKRQLGERLKISR